MGFLGRMFSGSKPVDGAIGAAVLVRSGERPDLDAVARRVPAVRREGDALLFRGPSERDEPIAVSVLGPLPPMPAALLDELADSAWWWEDARTAVRAHTNVIAVQVEGGRGDRVLRRRAVSAVAAALSHDALAVVWNDAAGLYEASEFREHVEASSGDEPPTPFWISLRIATAGNRRVFVSTGLRAFDHREIEIEVPPREPEAFAAVLHQLLRIVVVRGGRLSVGDRIPLNEQVALRVVEVAGSSLPGRPDVLHLALV